MLPANLTALRSRFPRVAAALEHVEAPSYSLTASPCPAPIVNGRQVVSGYDPIEEARTQAAALPVGAAEMWLYGIGLGHLPRAALARPDVRKVIAVSLSLPLLRLALSLGDQTDWLLDRRLYLCHGSDLSQVYGPYAVSAGELPQADPSAERVRDELEVDINRRFHRVQFSSQYDEDKANLDRAISLGDEHVPTLVEREKRPGRLVVCAGGPTLDEQLAWLAGEKAADPDLRIVSVNTALPALSRAGIAPDYAVVIDSHPNSLRQLDGVDLSLFAGTALVYDRVVPFGYMERWPGRRAWAVTGLSGDLWADGTVTHAATHLAVKLGATEVTLLGADFCYAHNLTHNTAVFHSDPVKDGPAMRHTVDGEGRDVLTIASLVHFRRRLERFIEAHPGVVFYKRGRAGVPVEGARWAA